MGDVEREDPPEQGDKRIRKIRIASEAASEVEVKAEG